jgi:serine/threonine protein kinase
MEEERYRRIDELFDSVLEIEPARRRVYLQEICASDSDLRREVESLLAAHEQAANFIEKPALEVAARHLVQAEHPSLIGRSFAQYEIISLLGQGGMGEVYLAQDLRLGRKVALKLLPAQFTRDSDRVGRFQRESRAATALNHPNIITIYDMGQEQGIHFIASEFIEGDTLRQKLNRRKLPVKEAIEIAIQVGDALSAAHRAGIIHRDIKPENIMIRRDGYIKVLDFGLVKLTESDDTHQAAVKLSTKTGAVMGTINYMSPEQALALEIDPRTDIFSLGIVLYEMVTGELPFKGTTAASVFDAILNKQPASIRSANAEVSVELERIIYRALEKDREMRYQTAADLRSVLRRLRRNLDSGITASAEEPAATGASEARPGVSHWWMKVAVVFMALTVFLLMTLLLFSKGRVAEQSISWQNAKISKVTDQAGPEFFPSLSPDGKSVIYASPLSGNWDIYLKRIGAKKADNLTEGSVDEDTQAAFSFDGKRIAFRSSREGGGIFIMSETGEDVRHLTKLGYNPAWSPDGTQIVCTENYVDSTARTKIPSKMWIVDVATGESRQLTDEKVDAVQANWSPKGHRIAFWGSGEDSRRKIWTISTGGGEAIPIASDAFVDWNPVWSPDGNHLYFISNRNGAPGLWRISIDEKTGTVQSAPERVPIPTVFIRHFSFSSDGKNLVYIHTHHSQNIKKLDFDPLAEKIVGEGKWITQSSSLVHSPSVSSDGEWLTYITVGIQTDLFVLKIGSTTPSQLTDDTYGELLPRWSPDNKRIVFYANRGGGSELWLINPDGSGLQQLTETNSPGVVYPVWSPDGLHLAYNLFGGTSYIMKTTEPFQAQTPEMIPLIGMPDEWLNVWSWSPDGKRLAGATGAPTGVLPSIYTYTLATKKFERLTTFGTRPTWLNDSRRLLFIDESELYLLDTQTQRRKKLYSFAPHSISQPTTPKDNRSIYLSVNAVEADIWLLTLE